MSASDYMKLGEVCGLLNMSKQSIYRAVRNKQIPHQRIIPGGPVKFIRKDILDFLKSRTFEVHSNVASEGTAVSPL